MGIEPFLVSSSLECLIAQRLIRLICPKCKIAIKNKEDALQQIKNDLGSLPQKIELYEGKGCRSAGSPATAAAPQYTKFYPSALQSER